jgi:hypothetical protein
MTGLKPRGPKLVTACSVAEAPAPDSDVIKRAQEGDADAFAVLFHAHKARIYSGGRNAVWIFQIAGTLTQASATRVILKGGALSKNIFWQTSGAVAIGTTAHVEGVILAKTMIAMNTGASANGRLLAQTAVSLEKNAVKRP